MCVVRARFIRVQSTAAVLAIPLFRWSWNEWVSLDNHGQWDVLYLNDEDMLWCWSGSGSGSGEISFKVFELMGPYRV
jgi:hypothetical protein